MTHVELLQRLRPAVGPYNVINQLKGDRLSDAGSTYHLYRARLNSFARTGLLSPPLVGFGFSDDEDLAALKAVCEAMERFSGVNFSNETSVYATWDAAPHALDPSSCIGYSTEQYASERFPFVPFDRTARHEWVPARHASSGKEVYVHADMVRMSSNGRLTRASSIGMAIHTDPEIAAESALLELIERDHLALAFWQGKAVIRLPIDSLSELEKGHLNSIQEAGYKVHCLRLDYGLDVPVILWVAFRQSSAPYFLKGAAAHRDPMLAQTKAFEEMFRSFLYYRCNVFEVVENAQGAMKNLMHYQTADVENRLGFLSDSAVVGELNPANPLPQDICTHLSTRGIEVYFVDMGNNYTRCLGLHCVRAIAPHLAKTPLGSEPWQLASTRLRGAGGPRDIALAANFEPHFFS